MNATILLCLLAQASEAAEQTVETTADPTSWTAWLPAVLIAVIGGAVLAVLSRWAGKAVGKHWSPGRGKLASKAVLYLGWFVLVLAVLNQLGFKLPPLAVKPECESSACVCPTAVIATCSHESNIVID